ncbi:hypothetical protein VPBG_00236 [Vibrio phage helene 12B3]|uniref:hypothetical protein n=1 Tax=Vibrio phage helene 12B3 TaxID=573173 RepID=UPI0002C0DE5E|nr:hypothetical protein VPBG_00236 [Vibrio phage helene 12B3]AGG58008.1 hypothetical protein VPBG_00236 [Vibrio phage helene 12B3]
MKSKYSIYPYRIKKLDRREYIVVCVEGIVHIGSSKTYQEALSCALQLVKERKL